MTAFGIRPSGVWENGGVSDPRDRQAQVRIRRAPKFSVFIVLGAVVGALVTLILTSLFPVDPSVGFGALFGYFAFYGVTAGVLVGAITALVFDRVLARRATTVVAAIESVDDATTTTATAEPTADERPASPTRAGENPTGPAPSGEPPLS